MVTSADQTNLPDAVPVSGSEVAGLSRDERLSASRIKDFFLEQYRKGQALRRRHAIAWVMVQSYLRHIHFFNIDPVTGRWYPIPKEEGKVRVAVPLLLPMFRHTLGFFNSNDLGVSTLPISSGVEYPAAKADRAEAAINGWIDETSFYDVFDRANQFLLAEGTFAYYRYMDFFRKNVFVRALGGSQVFPIPFDSTDPCEDSGVIIASVVSKGWLELQDKFFERQTGQKPVRKMADKTLAKSASMSLAQPFMGGSFGKQFEGALTLTVFMKETLDRPGGEYAFIVEDEMFRYASGDETIPIMGRTRDGEVRLPVEYAHFDKNPNDWLGNSFCESLVAMQAAKDRARSLLERSALMNRAVTFFDQRVIDPKDVQNQDAAFVPANFSQLAGLNIRQPIAHVPATPIGRDVVSVLQLQDFDADRAAGFRSGIVFGQQEGRTESGPATSLLAQNAMASLAPAMSRHSMALKRTYEGVLDMARYVWPKDKRIRVLGQNNMGREVRFPDPQKDIPWSSDVILRPRPILPGGRQTQLNILFQLRQIPGQDGVNGSMVKDREFRQSLREMNVLPPGISLGDKPESRIRSQINRLIGDGIRPMARPSVVGDTNDRLARENHRAAVDMYDEAILDDSFESFSPAVQKSLLQQAEFHRYWIQGPDPGAFDDEVQQLQSRQAEQFMSAAEADLFTPEGDFSLDEALT